MLQENKNKYTSSSAHVLQYSRHKTWVTYKNQNLNVATAASGNTLLYVQGFTDDSQGFTLLESLTEIFFEIQTVIIA